MGVEGRREKKERGEERGQKLRKRQVKLGVSGTEGCELKRRRVVTNW